MRETTRLSAASTFVIVFISVGVVWILFTLWQSNRISAQFQTLSKLAYLSVQECYDKVAEKEPPLPTCLDGAQMRVAQVGQLAKTQRERRQYADLHSFLTDVGEYHQKLSESNDPNELRQSRENLNRFRDRLEGIFR